MSAKEECSRKVAKSPSEHLCGLAPWREHKPSEFTCDVFPQRRQVELLRPRALAGTQTAEKRHEFSRKVAKTQSFLASSREDNHAKSRTMFPAKRQSRQGNSLRPRALAGAQTVKIGNHRPNFARILTARSSPSTFSRILSRRSRSRSLLTARNLVTTSSDSLPR